MPPLFQAQVKWSLAACKRKARSAKLPKRMRTKSTASFKLRAPPSKETRGRQGEGAMTRVHTPVLAAEDVPPTFTQRTVVDGGTTSARLQCRTLSHWHTVAGQDHKLVIRLPICHSRLSVMPTHMGCGEGAWRLKHRTSGWQVITCSCDHKAVGTR